MRSRTILAAATLALAACGGTGSGDVTEFDDIPTAVSVIDVAGDVIITGNTSVDGASVAASADGDDDPETSIELVAGVLQVSDTCDGSGCSVDYVIRTEGDIAVTVSTSAGNVTVSDTTGDVTIDVTDGNVTLASVTGDFQVIVGDGTIIGTRLETDSATFDSGSGDIDVTFDEPLTTLIVNTERGDVTVQLPDGDYAIETSPEEDGVDLLIDDNPAATNTVSLTTGDGEITVYKR